MSRYRHHLDDVRVAATDRVSDIIAVKMFEDVAEEGSKKRSVAVASVSHSSIGTPG